MKGQPEPARPTIVILDASIALTGGLRSAQRIAKLVAAWADTVLVLPRGAGISVEELRPFAAVERLPIVSLRRSPMAMLRYGPSLVANGYRLLQIMRRWRSERLIINDFPQLEGWVARRLGYRGRLLTWIRFDPQRFPGPLRRLWLAAAAAASDRLVAVSQFVQGRLPGSVEPMLLYDSVDQELLALPSRALPDPRILCVGNYISGKGQDMALEAFALVAGRFPEARLEFFGGDMGLQKNQAFLSTLKNRGNALALEDRIDFHDFATDLPRIFRDATAALNLSASESFSLTCLEASQLGVPVVAFRSGGPEEIIEDGVTGYLRELGDVRGVAEALAALLSDPPFARRMGDCAAASVRQRFNPDTQVAELRSLLEL